MENYIIHITSGRGPVECCMAVALALKQLLEEAEALKLEVLVLERIVGTEKRTLQSATVQLSGNEVNKFCTSWEGVLLWICQSHFRKYHKRKNWFIGIQIFNQKDQAMWREQDIVYQTMRSSGPGGQNVNKVESAVRATHNPSGLAVAVNESRSQLQNKKIAVERLKKMHDHLQLQELLKTQQEMWDQHNSLERGNPSRIYEGPNFKRK